MYVCVFVTGSVKTKHNSTIQILNTALEYNGLQKKIIQAYYYSATLLVKAVSNSWNLGVNLCSNTKGVIKFLFCCSAPKET